MQVDIQELKQLNRIEDVIDSFDEFKLDKRRAGSKHLKGIKHDSFVVNVDEQLYFWNAQNRGGDVLTFLETEIGMAFQSALVWLADRAGVSLQMSAAAVQRLAATRRRQGVLEVVQQVMEGKFAASAAAKKYAAERGWSTETVERVRLGFWDGDNKSLVAALKAAEVDATDPAAVAVLGLPGGDVAQWAARHGLQPRDAWLRDGKIAGMPRGMLVYFHMAGRRPVYFSGRAIGDVEKRFAHWNPQRELVGEREVYWNSAVGSHKGYVVIVEGQADAITLDEWRVPAVGLAGLSGIEALALQLEPFERVYLALDGDSAGQDNIRALAGTLGSMTRIVEWPAEWEGATIKDPNAWLVAGAEAGDCQDLLGQAPIYALWLAQQVEKARPMEREKCLDEAVAMVAELPEYVYEKVKSAAAKAVGISVRDLNNMARALKKTSGAGAHKQEMTIANGFYDDHLFELIYDGDHEEGPRTSFAVRYPNGTVSITPRLETTNYRIYPLLPNTKVISSGVLRLPSNVGNYDSEIGLQQTVQAWIHKYVDVPPDIERLASYYVMLTWLFDKFYVLPYLRARGSSDSGKSRFTEVVGELCMRAIFVTGSTTPSPVFRTMEKWNGMTVVMDEADLPHSETSADWVQMLNTGYKQGFGILRTNMSNGEATVDVFSAFGPKILNMRGRFVDDATESRCLTWETSSGRGIRADIERFIQDREGYYAEARDIRNRLLAFRLRRWGDVTPDYNHEAMKNMPGRLVEITVPLLSISQEPEFRASIMQFVEAMNRQAITARAVTLPAKILEGILYARYLPDEKSQELPDALQLQVAHITRQANRIINMENQEASLWEADDDDPEFRPVKQISSGRVGKVLNNELNLSTEKSQIGTRPMVLVWDEERVGSLIVRYGLEELVADLMVKERERAAAAAAAPATGEDQAPLAF